MDDFLVRLIEALQKFRYIYVSGPQRSGTRIASQILAHELQIKYIDEADFGVGNRLQLKVLLSNYDRAVIQCPALSRYIHVIAENTDCVVFMMRPISDIMASEQRINWQCEKEELAKYDRTTGIISQVKYNYWYTVQKETIEHCIDLYYSDLKSHPLFVDKEFRQHFEWNQTKC